MFERLPQVAAGRIAANDAVVSPVRARPLVGLIRNARSHLNIGASGTDAADESVLVRTPARRSELRAILAEFAERQVDCIAISGGDGTVRDVLTCGAGVFGEAWPTLIVLPAGKTNALAHEIGVPKGWTLDAALAALSRGRVERRRPLVISQLDDERAQVRGFIMGAGVFNRAIALGQRSHRIGFFNAAVIGATAWWALLQALFGSRSRNEWRLGTAMRLRDGQGREIPHLGGLPAGERYFLFASTLKRFPAGLDPFARIDDPLGLVLFDNPRRGLLLRIGAIARGMASAATLRRGAHVLGGEAFALDLAEPFILDGEAFPPGHYQLSAGALLRFVVP